MSARDSSIGQKQGGGGTCLLTINAGSSSLKFAVFRCDAALTCILKGSVERIGLSDSVFLVTDVTTGKEERRSIHAPNHGSCVEALVDLLKRKNVLEHVNAIGHRVVHGGMRYRAPEAVTAEMIEELRRISLLAIEHLPAEIEWMEAFAQGGPERLQVACFDTAFHSDLPRVALMLPLPRRLEALGVRRYGFHGLSYEFLMEELSRVDALAARGRVILAHLGNGASMSAVLNGKCVDTSMGFTPAAGLMMGRRTGDLDPGVFAHLARTEGMMAEQFHLLVNQQSGLLGVSETTSDMQELLVKEKEDVRAAEAIALFCQQAKKWIGSFAAVLGGLDTLVFAGGIGENCPSIRARMCDGLGFLGVGLDDTRNQANAAMVSCEGSKASVRVMHTDEERMIARSVSKVLEERSVM